VRHAGVAAGCRFRLEASDVEDVRRRAAAAREHRQASQPWRDATAGSVFKNPPGDHAGRVLEALGFKGKRRGGAGFSGLHANFLVNHGGSSFADAFGLCEEARDAALGAGVSLSYELEIWRAGEMVA
jgi:UDP-N-acetylmuramate dehydrogenase